MTSIRGCWRRDKTQPQSSPGSTCPRIRPRAGAQRDTCRVGLARHPPQALITVPHPLLEGLLQHLGPAILQAQSWVRASGQLPCWPARPTVVPAGYPSRLPPSPPISCCVLASSRWAGKCDKARAEPIHNGSKPLVVPTPVPYGPAPSLPLTGTEENRHIQARWTRLCRYPDQSTSLMAAPASPRPVFPAPGCVLG